MRRLIWLIVKPLFLYQKVSMRHKLPGDSVAQTYERVTLIPAPGPEMLVGLLILGFVWYVAWIGGFTWYAFGSWDWHVTYPAMPLAFNSTMRGSLKVREQRSDRAKWPSAVGRQRTGVWLSVIVIGALAGALAGVLLEFTLYRRISSLLPLWLIIALPAVWEAILNSRHIGGKVSYGEFDLAEHQKWYRVLDQAERPKHFESGA